jgi:endo-1,4-beta-mannosidase
VSQPFILGVNYWPRRKAMYWWSNFDASEVAEEFDVIRDLGLNVVRIFLLWDDFMPTPDTVSPDALRALVKVADIAAERNLGLDITFFTGHMSGPNWSPRWLLDQTAPMPSPHVRQVVSRGKVVTGGYRNPFTDLIALDSERLLLLKVVRELRQHPAVWLWNLGNEPDLFAWPPDSDKGQAWVREMTNIIRALDNKHPVTTGLHIASLHLDNGLRVDKVFAEAEFGVMHTYPMYVDWARSPLDSDVVPFSVALTAALSGKQILMEEFGGPTNAPGKASETWSWTAYGQPRTQFVASEEALAEYLEAVLPKLVDVGALGAMLWCYADYAPELWQRPPCDENRHERFFGLVRPDGSLKPHARVIQQFAATKPTVQTVAPRRLTLDITPDEYYRSPTEHLIRLYQRYLNES